MGVDFGHDVRILGVERLAKRDERPRMLSEIEKIEQQPPRPLRRRASASVVGQLFLIFVGDGVIVQQTMKDFRRRAVDELRKQVILKLTELGP